MSWVQIPLFAFKLDLLNTLNEYLNIKKMIFTTHFDSPALWQTYLSDPASITMEGILIFNKHLLFLLTVIVLFVG